MPCRVEHCESLTIAHCTNPKQVALRRLVPLLLTHASGGAQSAGFRGQSSEIIAPHPGAHKKMLNVHQDDGVPSEVQNDVSKGSDLASAGSRC